MSWYENINCCLHNKYHWQHSYTTCSMCYILLLLLLLLLLLYFTQTFYMRDGRSLSHTHTPYLALGCLFWNNCVLYMLIPQTVFPTIVHLPVLCSTFRTSVCESVPNMHLVVPVAKCRQSSRTSRTVVTWCNVYRQSLYSCLSRGRAVTNNNWKVLIRGLINKQCSTSCTRHRLVYVGDHTTLCFKGKIQTKTVERQQSKYMM